jgi:hypothetical protein
METYWSETCADRDAHRFQLLPTETGLSGLWTVDSRARAGLPGLHVISRGL